jgi:hypothetical protein
LDLRARPDVQANPNYNSRLFAGVNEFDEDSAELGVTQEDVVGPFQAYIGDAETRDHVRNCNPDRKAETLQAFGRDVEPSAQAERDVPARRAQPCPAAPTPTRRLPFGQAHMTVDVDVPCALNEVCIRRANLVMDHQFGKPGTCRTAQFREDCLVIE